MKRYFYFAITLVFLAALTGCGGGGGGGGGGGSSSDTATTPMDFVIAFPTNFDIAQTPNLSLLISGQAGIQGSVDIPGLPFSATFTTDSNGSATVSIPSSAVLNAWDTVQLKGIFVHANDKVNVVAVNDLPGLMGAYTVLPVTVLGTNYYVASAGSGVGGYTAGSFLSIVGTADGTTVSVTPTSLASGHAAGVSFTISLNRGGAYQLAADTVAGDLAASLVQSDKPVVVFGGHIAGTIPAVSGYVGFLVGQVPPTMALGTEFLTVPLATRSQYRIRLIGIQNGTALSIVGASGPASIIINAGEVINIATATAARVVTDGKPLLMVQLAEGSAADGVAGADPCMAVIPPVSQYASSYVIATPPTSANVASRYVNLIVPSSAVASIRLNGTAIGSSVFTAIGTTGYYAASVAIPPGTNRITSDGTQFGALVYGWGEAGSENGFCFAPTG